MSLGARLSYSDLLYLLLAVLSALCAGLEAEHNCDWLFFSCDMV